MRIEPYQAEIGIVLIGSFNPAIFNPDWFLRNDLIGQSVFEEAETKIIIPDLANFKVGEFTVEVSRERFSVTLSSPPYVQLKDMFISIFSNLLPHSIVGQAGINYAVHFKVGSESERNRIGRVLAPSKPWGEWSAKWDAQEGLSRSGMVNVSLIEIHPDHPAKRRTTITVQPSYAIPKNIGIFSLVNDHYEVNATGKAASEVIKGYFDESLAYSEWIIDQLMALKGADDD